MKKITVFWPPESLKKSRFNLQLIISFAILLFAFISCNNLINSDDNSYSQNPSGTEEYINFTGRCSLDGAYPRQLASARAQNTGMEGRSALPQIDSSYEYFVEASSADGKTSTGGVNPNLTFSIPLAINHTWTITAGIRKTGSTDKIVFSAESDPVTPDRTATSFENLNLILKPCQSGSGSVSLAMTVPEAVKKIETECSDTNWKDNIEAGLGTSGAYIRSKSDGSDVNTVKSGIYNIIIKFYDQNDFILFSIPQTVNVIDNMKTNLWRSGESSDSPITEAGLFTLQSDHISNFASTVIYVGKPNVLNERSDVIADDSNSGHAYSPLASLGAALSKIEAAGDKTKDYTIYISGHLTGCSELSAALGTSDDNKKAKSITLCGLTGLSDGVPQDVLDGNADGSTLKINTTVPVTIKNLKITGGKATNGGGINIAKGSVTLGSGAFITQNNADISYAKGNGVYLAGETSLTMKAGAEISNNKNTNCFGGGIYTAKDSTFIMEGGTIKENSASMGGGIHYTGTVTIKGGLITKNTASTNGGGLYNSTNIPSAMSLTYVITTLTITGGTISENSAPTGGALYFCKPVISGSAYIPYGVDGVTGKGKNDVYFGTDDSVCGTKITVAGNLSRHSATDPIALSWPDSYWSRGHVAVEADGTKVTDLTSFKDLFTLTNDDWSLKLSSDNSALKLDSPIYVAGNNYKVCTNPGSYSSETTGEKSAPFDTIGHACSLLSDSNCHYTILVDGELNGDQTLPASGIAAASITLKGANSFTSNDDRKDIINAGGSGTALSILYILSGDTSVPVTIENLKITGGAQGSGGAGIHIGNYRNVTLGDDLLVQGNNGPGVYVSSSGATLNVNGNVVVSGNKLYNDTIKPCNVYLPDGKTINVFGALKKGDEKAQIGISTENPPTLTSKIPFTTNYGIFNNVAPGTYFTGDQWTVAAGSDGEACLAASGGNITIEPVYEDITVNVDKTSVLKSATEKKFTFSATGTDSEGNTSPITIGNGEGQLALTIDSVTYHGETMTSPTHYTTGANYVTLDNSLPAGNYTINTRAVYQGSLSEARTYSASFEVKIKESNIENVSSGSQAVSAISAMTESGTIKYTGALTTDEIQSMKEALNNLDTEKPDVEVTLDLSGVTGYTVIENCYKFFYENPNIVSLTFPEGITEIPAGCLRGLSKLKTLNLPSTVQTFGVEQICYLCPLLETVTIGGDPAGDNGTVKVVNNVVYSSDGKKLWFYGNKASTADLVVPDGVEEIYKWAFATSHFTKVTLPASLNTVGFGAFIDLDSTLTTVNYKGSESDKSSITIDGWNEAITNLTWNCNYTGD